MLSFMLSLKDTNMHAHILCLALSPYETKFFGDLNDPTPKPIETTLESGVWVWDGSDERTECENKVTVINGARDQIVF